MMADGKNNMGQTVEALFKGLDGFMSTKTVVGEAVTFADGTIVVPLVDVSFGVGAGAFANGERKKDRAAGGMGGSMQPSAVLVIQNGTVKLVNVKNQDGLTKILDMVPDFVNKFLSGKEENMDYSADFRDEKEE